MSDIEFGVQHNDGRVTGETTNLDDAVAELLWAMDMRSLVSLQEMKEARRFYSPRIVVRDFEDDDPVLWAPLEMSDEELYEAAQDVYGEVG